MQPHAPFRLRTILLGMCCAIAMLSLTACQAPSAGKPLVAEFPKDDPDSQLEFWHRLEQRPMTSNDDAFHGLLLYLDGSDASTDYAGRVANLKAKHMLPGGFDRPGDEAVLRGTMAVAIAKAVDLHGGVMYTLLGPTPRYATRELQNEGLYPLSTPNQIFTGAEFVGIIGRLEDYQRGTAADKPAADVMQNAAEPVVPATK